MPDVKVDNAMKKITCLGIVAVILNLPVMAQDYPAYRWQEQKQKQELEQRQTQKPQPTTPGYIAMLFYKLSGKAPDFESWARRTEAYQAAAGYDRLSVQDRQAQLLKNIYDLLTFHEPLIVETPVKLSEYSALNKGFFVESFRTDTFFPFRYNDRSYAVVPSGIMDQQWIKAPDPAVVRAIQAASRNDRGKSLSMVLMLTPKYADSFTPATLEGRSYWLISAEAKKMMLYAPDSPVPLWKSDDGAAPDDTKRQELLRLRQQ